MVSFQMSGFHGKRNIKFIYFPLDTLTALKHRANLYTSLKQLTNLVQCLVESIQTPDLDKEVLVSN